MISTTRGGAGRNQGRRPLNGNKKAIRVTVTVTEDDLVYLDQLSPVFLEGARAGERNRSEGVRRALLACRREETELSAEALRRSAAAKTDPSLLVSDEEFTRQIAAKVGAHVAN